MLISQSSTILGFGRTWPTGIAAFFVGLVSFTVAGRLRVPPLVVVVSAVVPMLPGLSIYRGLSLLAEGGPYDSLGPAGDGHGGLGRDLAVGRRDPRRVRRPAAQAGGAPPREPAGRSAPGRSAPRHRARRCDARRGRVAGAVEPAEQVAGAVVRRRWSAPRRAPVARRIAGRPRRRGSRTRPGARRTRPRRRPTPARSRPRTTSRSRSTARSTDPSHSGGVVMSTYTSTGPPAAWNVASHQRSAAAGRRARRSTWSTGANALGAGPVNAGPGGHAAASRRARRCRGTPRRTPSAAGRPTSTSRPRTAEPGRGSPRRSTSRPVRNCWLTRR